MVYEMVQGSGTPSAGLAVGVFCGARPGCAPSFTESAREAGTLLAIRGHSLIYGGGERGVMGAIACAARQAGASVTGVIPRFLFELEREDILPDRELIVTADMFERKRQMFARADAFLALPGGYGTLDEVIEIMCLNSLRQRPRPLVLLDVDEFWAPLVQALMVIHDCGFAPAGMSDAFQVTADPAAAIEALETMAGLARFRRVRQVC